MAIASLVDEHVLELRRLYAEAARLIEPGGHFVIVGYHPHFIMASGMPTHFHRPSGEPVAVETHVHLFSQHVTDARKADLTMVEMHEEVLDEAWCDSRILGTW